MYCKNCGKQIDDNSKYCPECGTLLIDNSTIDVVDEKPKKEMNKALKGILIGLGVLVLLLGAKKGIEQLTGLNVQYIADRSIQYEETTDSFTLLFSFKDKSRKYVSSDATFEIKIVNDDGETIYEGTKDVSKTDFSIWTSQAEGERYLGSVSIPCSEIKKGKTTSGLIYFTVYKNGDILFDESTLDIAYHLPIAQAQLSAPSLPITVGEYWSMLGSAKVCITDIDYELDEYTGTMMAVNLSGEVVHKDSSFSQIMFTYKVLDKEGRVVDSGTAITDNLSVGDKFKNLTIYVKNIIPGEQYCLELSDYRA